MFLEDPRNHLAHNHLLIYYSLSVAGKQQMSPVRLITASEAPLRHFYWGVCGLKETTKKHLRACK